MKRISFALALLVLLTSGCGALWGYFAGSSQSGQMDTISGGLSQDGRVADLVSLVDSLRDAGATVEPKENLEQDIFSVAGQVITVDGKDVQVYEYANDAAAGADAALIAPDAGSIGTTMITWVAAPHVYRSGKLIVLYVGDDPATTVLLESLLGPQVAGR